MSENYNIFNKILQNKRLPILERNIYICGYWFIVNRSPDLDIYKCELALTWKTILIRFHYSLENLIWYIMWRFDILFLVGWRKGRLVSPKSSRGSDLETYSL